MSNVKKELIKGTVYNALSKYSGIFVSLCITAVLARLLTPEDFGVVAIISLFITFFNILANFGIGSAVIQNQTLTNEDINSIYTFSIYLGVIVSLLFFLFTPIIGKMYENEQLVPLGKLMCIPMFLGFAQMVPSNVLMKEKRFKEIAVLTILFQILGGVVSIILAFLGFGLYTLIISPIISGVLSLIAFTIKSHLHFQISFSFTPVKKIMSFSIYQFLFNTINYFARNLDNLLLGKYLGPAALGFYEKSYRLMQMPLQNIPHVITPVVLPVLAEYQNDLKFVTDKYFKLLKVIAYISFPISILCFFISEEITLLLFGNQWVDSIEPFQILSLSISCQMLATTTGSIFQTIGKTKTMFYSCILTSGEVIIAIIFSLEFFGTLRALSIAVSAAMWLSCFSVFAFLFYELKVRYLELFKIMFVPFVISVAMGGILYGLELLMGDTGYFVSLFMKSLVGTFMTILSVQILQIYDIWGYGRNVLAKFVASFKK